MKRFLFSLSVLAFSPAFAAPGIHEALADPAKVNVLKLCGEKNEAALLLQHAKQFSSLQQIIISGISDSLLAEQDVLAVAACPGVHRLSFENCGLKHLSPAVKMLVAVNEVAVVSCRQMDASALFAVLSGMPALKQLSYTSERLLQLPRSFISLRSLGRISISNKDISLAEGYAANHSDPAALFVKDSTCLGFGKYSLFIEYGCYNESCGHEHLRLIRDLLQGVAGTNGVLPLPQQSLAFDAHHPLVKPPIPGLDIRKDVYTVSALTGGTITYPSGTKISFPAQAFADENGNAVKGEVAISYREFRDPVDILVSGIPMKYNNAGKQEDFESAGMFEMNASVNGKEVFLAPGKKAELQFAVVDTASTFNFYRLDEKQGWEYLQPLGKTEAAVPVATTRTPDATESNTSITATNAIMNASAVASRITAINSAAARDFIWRANNITKKKPMLYDTTSFENVYRDTAYCYTRKFDSSLTGTENKYGAATQWRVMEVRSGRSSFCFRLSNRFKKSNYSGHNPEMSVYRNVTWMLDEKMSRSALNQLRSDQSGINDLRVNYEGGTAFTLELKVPDGFLSMHVTPVMHDSTGAIVALPAEKCAALDAHYTKILQHRKASFTNAIIHRRYAVQRWAVKLQRDSVREWGRSKELMTPQEQAMDFRTWVNYSRINSGYNFQTNSFSPEASVQKNAVCQALTVMKFGIYNCDQIQRINNPVSVPALAYSTDEKPQNAPQMYVIDNKRNQAFSYTGFAGEPITISFGAKEENKLIVVNVDGTVALADTELFKARKQTPQGNTRFPVVVMADKPVTVQQLREFIYPPVVQQ